MRFQLTVLDKDHAILTTRERIPPEKIAEMKATYERWRDHGGLLVAEDTETVSYSTSIELDLTASPAEARHERLVNQDRQDLRPDDQEEDPYEAWVETHGGRVALANDGSRGDRG